MDELIENFGFVSFSAASAAFLALALLLTSSRRHAAVGLWLISAAASTALWAASEAYAAASPSDTAERIARGLELLRYAGWLGFFLSVLSRTQDKSQVQGVRSLVVIISGTIIGVLLITEVIGAAARDAFRATIDIDVSVLGRVGLTVMALLMVENLFRNTRAEHRWAIKFLCTAAAGIFAYDFFMFADALLFKRVNPGLADARGLINAVIVPLIAISAARNPKWSLDVFVSRRVIFYSATLVAAGIYLLVMAGAGYYVRRFGGEWGTALQAIFLFAAGVLIAIILFSGSVRAWIKVLISKHFFNYRYDYREEWLRFIRTISSVETGGALPVRVIQAVADIVESPEGALWMREDDGRFAMAAAWNRPIPVETKDADPRFAQFLEEKGWVIDLNELALQPERYPELAAPDWLRDYKRAWLVVPLLHLHRLRGFLLLSEPRSPKSLNWEDFDLLKTVGRQAASYLAEQAAARALVESHQFDEFNRRFAFVLHDIKNLVSQLTLILSNAAKHKKNPEFQEDMLQTVKESVEKLNRLLVRLHQSGKEAAATTPVSLAPFLTRTIAQCAKEGRNLSFECQADSLAIAADEERLGAVMAHLIANAFDATKESGGVRVRLRAEGGDAVIEVEDDGIGMTPEFLRDQLFQPFRTTKADGYGIGAYESRAFVRELGGRLDVASVKGQGTTVRISLPSVQWLEC